MIDRLLVSGGEGFIGSYLCSYFLKLGYTVAVIDNYSNSQPRNIPNVKVYEGDILDRDFVERVLLDFNPDVVSHHAAQISTVYSIENPTFDAMTNVIGTMNVYELSMKAGVKKVLIASSGGAIYGESDYKQEYDDPDPVTPYGLSKLVAEEYVQMMFEQSDRKTIPYFLRYANVYGPGQGECGEGGVISIFARKLSQDETLCVFGRETEGDSGCIRDYVFVDDIARVHRFVIEKNACILPRTINVASAVGTSTYDLACTMSNIWNKELNIDFSEPRIGDTACSVLSNTVMVSELGINPTPLSVGLLKLKESLE